MNNSNEKKPDSDLMPSLLSQLQGMEQPFIITLVNLIPHPLFFMLSDGTFTECNAAFENKIYGKPKQSLIGNSFADIQPNFFTQEWTQFLDRFLKTHENRCFKTHLQYTDFQVRQVSISLGPFTCSGNKIGLIGFINDISIQNDYDRVVRTSEQKYLKLFEESNDAIFIHDEKGHILDVNKLSIELFGYTKSEFLSLDIPALYQEIPESSFLYNHPSNSYREQKTLRKKNGELIYCDISSRPFDTSGKLIQSIIRDISQLKSIETALKQSLEEVKNKVLEAEKSNQLKDKFLSIIRYEFWTSLNGITGMAELLYQTTINKEQKDYIEIISRSSEDMIGLVNNAIDFSKLSNGTLTLLPSEIDLIESIEFSISTISAKASEKNLKFSFTTDFDLPSFVVADSTRLMQVIEILISNAIKFTYTGSVHLEATQLLRNSSEVTLQFKVIDTGPGIEESRKKNTFKTFFQIDESATTRSRGTGLGLVIAKHIVEMMNGTIDFESCPGEGSVFWFKVVLPICQTPKNFIPSNSTPGTIAIIDPDNTAYTTLSQYLKFDNPQSSISKYSSINNISLLSDFDLIIINGENINYSLLKKMHSESSKTPIVNITSKPEDNTNQNPLFTQTLTRPFSRQSVINKLAGINKEKPEEKRVNFSFVDPHGLHVLVVDDNQINQKVATKMLTHLGCTAEVANNGFDALSMLSCNRYELVLLDLQMPLIDGYGVISEIRNPSSTVLDHEVPVIAMTALNSEEDRKKCHDSGMNSFIVKPITVSELNLVIESSFRNHSFFKNISENNGVVS